MPRRPPARLALAVLACAITPAYLLPACSGASEGNLGGKSSSSSGGSSGGGSSGSGGSSGASSGGSSGGFYTGSASCGKVAYSDFHVSAGTLGTAVFPAECPTAMADPGATDLFEFFLFDTMSCAQDDTKAPVAPPL